MCTVAGCGAAGGGPRGLTACGGGARFWGYARRYPQLYPQPSARQPPPPAPRRPTVHPIHFPSALIILNVLSHSSPCAAASLALKPK
jgi:hypothetical protein